MKINLSVNYKVGTGTKYEKTVPFSLLKNDPACREQYPLQTLKNKKTF